MCEFTLASATQAANDLSFDADTGDAVQRLVGLNRRKSEEWCEYPVCFIWRRVIAPGPQPSEAVLMTMTV